MTNREIAQEISSRIGNSPVPFDSVYSIALQIYNELGGEETQFDSVYSILLEILPLVEGGGKAIEEVDELPEDPAENKDKLFRLDNGEKDVYAAKLVSSETITTNRLPDEQQIDKAFLFETEYDRYYYKGAYKIICADGELDWYFWWPDGLDQEYFYGYATEDNAVNANNDTVTIWVDRDDSENWSEVTNTYARTEHTIDELMNGAADTLGGFAQIPIPAIYNAPESAQINWNATILDDGYGTIWWYTGEEATVEVDSETITGYKWIESYSTQPSGDYIISTKKASEIYYFGLTEDNIAFNSDTMFYYNSGSQATFEYPSKVNICTLNASNAEQIGNAYFTSKEYAYHPARTYHYYYNNEVTVHCTDGDMLMYSWVSEFGVGAITLKEPTYIYSKVEAVSTESWTPGILEEETGEYTYSSTKSALISEFNSQNKIKRESDIPDILPDIQGQIKYQREEVIEEWRWENIIPPYATTADIEALFTEPVPPSQPNDEIWYTTNTSEAIDIDPESAQYYFDKSIVSNTYSDGKGIIKFDGDLTSIEDALYNITGNYDILTSVSIPESVTNLAYGYGLFSGCYSLITAKLPTTYEGGIGDSFFSGCENLETVIIPEGTTYIGDGAFGGCLSLTTITIPSNVTNIGPSAFDNCENLTSIVCEPTTPPEVSSAVFENTNDCPIYVPGESVNDYMNAEGWSEYASRIQAIQ